MMARTGQAKPSHLGPPYHYHETGDGPDQNTTDSTIDDDLHRHGYAIGLNQAVDTGPGWGADHDHEMPVQVQRPLNIRPGLGEKNNELKRELQDMCELVIRLASNFHGSARFYGHTGHSGPSWRKCKSWICRDALRRVEGLADYMLPKNPHALRQYRANLKRLQKAIHSKPPELD